MKKQDKKEQIQNLRKELKNLLTQVVIPTRDKLDILLKEQAQLLCPFEIEDIITLNNGKKGIISEINYHSIDYLFANINEDDMFSEYFPKPDVVEDKFSYSVDDKEFSITWSISGFRMKNNDTEVGKIRFNKITPIDYIFDIESKTFKDKPLSNMLNVNDLTVFNGIK